MDKKIGKTEEYREDSSIDILESRNVALDRKGYVMKTKNNKDYEEDDSIEIL
jgi:hypothetical protein